MLAAFRGWAILTLLLHLLAYRLPEELFWSVWPFSRWPFWFASVLVVLAGLLIIPQCNRKIQIALVQFWQSIPGKQHPQSWFIAMALLSLPIFWLARIRHLGWGDANILVVGLSHPQQTVIYNWQAPLTVYLHQRLWALVGYPYWGWGVETVYAMVSVLCGGGFVYLLLKLALDLGRDTLERVLIVGFVLTSGAMQLFFGYVENYTLISLLSLIFLWLGIRVMAGTVPLWGAILTLAIANACHPSTMVLWPAGLYLAWRRYRQGGSGSLITLSLLLPLLIVANSVLTLMELGDHGLVAFLGDDRPGGGDHIWFVPLLATRTKWERYTMFSGDHLIEWVNEHFLISTFGLVAILVVAIWLWQTRHQRLPLKATVGHQLWFLGLASAGYLSLTWVWNADYGIRKDWDLFAPSAFVYSLFAALLLGRFMSDRDSLAQTTLIIVVVSALHTSAWVFVNTQPLFL